MFNRRPNLTELSVKDAWGTEDKPGLLSKQVPELLLLQGTLEQNTWHNNETTWTHTMQVCENVRTLLARPDLSQLSARLHLFSNGIDGLRLAELFAWANVLHDIAKPVTQDIHIFVGKRRSLYPGHEARGAEMSARILNGLPGFTPRQINWITYVVRWHGEMHAFFGLTDDIVFEARRDAWIKAHPDYWRELFLHSWADTFHGHLEVTNKAEYDLRLARYATILGDK
jgi:hypothetical protein